MREKLRRLSGRQIEGAFFHGKGCEECRGTGYRGRIGIFELLALTPELKRNDFAKTLQRRAESRRAKNMMTMHQDALQKAAAGITSLEEILRVSSGDLHE